MSLRSSLAGLIVVAQVAVPLAGPGRAQEAPPCTWSIGIMGALTGDAARYGRPISDGIRLAVDLANRERDLACALAVHAEDTLGDPGLAPPQAQQLIDDQRVVACICGFFSGETLATGEMFDEAGLLMASTGSNGIVDEQGFDTWFRAVAADPVQGAATARYIVEALGARSVSVVHDNQDYSKAVADDVADALGNRVDERYVINPEETDHSAVVAQIEQRKPDVVYFGGYWTQAGPLLRQLREAGVRSPFVTAEGSKHRRLGRYLQRRDGPARAKAACPCSDPAEIEAASTFVAEFETTYGRRPRSYAPDAFDVTNIAIDALRGLTGTESVEQARAHVVSYFDAADDVEGTVKDYTWNDRGELVADASDVFIWRWLERLGRFEYVGRISELTASR